MRSSTRRPPSSLCRGWRRIPARRGASPPSAACRSPTSPGNSAAAFTLPRPFWSGPGPRSAASTKRGKAMMPDPLEALRLPVIPVEPRAEFTAGLGRRLGGEQVPARGATVRYFVADLDAAVAFYRDDLGFDEELRPAPSFAMLYRGDLRLLLSVPGQAHDLGAAAEALRARGVRFRREILTGVGVRQALLEDPSGNPVELFEPLA